MAKNYLSYVKKAWDQTFLPLANPKQRENMNLERYVNNFIGWPGGNSNAKKAFYFLTLTFITTPLVNLFKIFTTFFANLIAESMNFLGNKLSKWLPENPFAKGLKYIALGLTAIAGFAFKALHTIFRCFTSPFDSAKLGFRTHWALGVLSILVSALTIGIAAAFVPLVPLFTGLGTFKSIVEEHLSNAAGYEYEYELQANSGNIDYFNSNYSYDRSLNSMKDLVTIKPKEVNMSSKQVKEPVGISWFDGFRKVISPKTPKPFDSTQTSGSQHNSSNQSNLENEIPEEVLINNMQQNF